MRIDRETPAVGLARPSAVYVYDFAVDPSDVKLDPGGPLQRIRERLSGGLDPGQQDEQVIALGRELADQLAANLTRRITAMGLPAQRIGRGIMPPVGDAAVAGQFVDVDEGNRVRRMAIGFHQGQSRVAAQVQCYQVTGAAAGLQLIDFTAVAESAPLPGAAVTMGAGAAVQVAAATAGGKELRDTIQADADKLAAKVAAQLQTFFAEQGWTQPPSTFETLPY